MTSVDRLFPHEGVRTFERTDDEIGFDLPVLPRSPCRDHAARCLHLFLPVHQVRRNVETQVRRLLRILLIRLGAVPARSAGTSRGRCRPVLLQVVSNDREPDLRNRTICPFE